MKIYRFLTLASVVPFLGGCQAVLLSPAGDVAIKQRNLLIASTALMLLIIVPVMVLTVVFAWHYRAGNTTATHDPDFHHSTGLEVVIWSVPLLIIVALGAITWMGTHLLDPYRPITRADSAPKTVVTGLDPVTPAAASKAGPLVIQVVALDWKWLFLYPEQGIASLNDVALPLDRPVEFRITASTVMNSFFVPALAGQIYAMPGMETKLNAILNKGGDYEGFSANYSGAGFSGMHFVLHGLDDAGFDDWVGKARSAGGTLGRADYLKLERPSENEQPRAYKSMAPGLYDLILNRCVDQAKMCTHDMMAIDARGGGGREGIWSVLAQGRPPASSSTPTAAPPKTYVAAICTQADVYGLAPLASRALQRRLD